MRPEAAIEPRVTAVVVNYNAGSMLSACVESLLAGGHIKAVVVVDNASSDDSVDQLRTAALHDPRVCIIENSLNRGYSVAINQGLTRVVTEFVLIVNPDCVVGTAMVGALLEAVEREPAAGVCGGIVLDLDGRMQRATRRHYPSPARALNRALWLGPRGHVGHSPADFDRSQDPLPSGDEDVDAVSGALMLVRMSAVAAVGGMDEGYFLHCEDLDWCMRFRRARWPVRFAPVGFAIHVQGVSGRGRTLRVQWHLHRGMARFYRRFEAKEHDLAFNTLVFTAIWIRFATLALLRSVPRGCVTPNAVVIPEVERLRDQWHRIEAFKSPGMLLIGARSPVAEHVLRRRHDCGGTVLAVGRSVAPVMLDEGAVWLRSDDGSNLPDWARRGLRTLVHVAPLWTLPAYLDSLHDIALERVVACSSTSAISKLDSADPAERSLAGRLAQAEDEVRARCEARGIALTLFRPTLIYSPGRDRSIERIARVVRRLGIFAVAGSGRGLRQPVHADDVAEAMLRALDQPRAAGQCYVLSGGETLSYRDMVARVFDSVGRKARILHIPVALYRVLLTVLRRLPPAKGLSPRAADRMEQDLCFDHEAATRDLGFQPRRFMEQR